MPRARGTGITNGRAWKSSRGRRSHRTLMYFRWWVKRTVTYLKRKEKQRDIRLSMIGPLRPLVDTTAELHFKKSDGDGQPLKR